MTTHSQHNNVEAATAASDHNKRVSFGAEEHVQMIVYDDGINDDYSIGQQNNRHQQQQTARHTFTEPDAPPSRVRVHAEQAEVPRPISPPAQLAPVMMDMTAAHSSTSSGGGNNAISASAPALQMINSPPLPSFARREDNSDNPFRPDEQLYHEVDPIVEMYRQRPFPPSPTHSPVPPHQQQQQQQTPSRTTPSRSGVANGGGSAGGGGGGRHSSLAEARREANQTHPAELADSAAAADGLLGPPGRAEVVRMPDKKKRACCSLQ